MSSSYYNFDFQTIIISSLWNHIVFPTTMYDPGAFVPNRWKWMDIWTSGLSSQVQSILSSCTNTPGQQSDPPKKNLDVDKKFPKPSKLLHTHTHTHTHTHQQAMSVWMGHFSKWGIPYIYIIIYVIGAFCGTWTKWKFRKCFFWGHPVLYVQDLLSLWPFSYGFFASRLQYKVLIMIFLLILFFRLQ